MRERKVYLPGGSGTTWTDAWAGERHAAGTTVSAAAPLNGIPLFLRDGAGLSIKPIG